MNGDEFDTYAWVGVYQTECKKARGYGLMSNDLGYIPVAGLLQSGLKLRIPCKKCDDFTS
jgi:hypothetical protein